LRGKLFSRSSPFVDFGVVALCLKSRCHRRLRYRPTPSSDIPITSAIAADAAETRGLAPALSYLIALLLLGCPELSSGRGQQRASVNSVWSQELPPPAR
jgi:hypothetical protein